MTMPWWSLWKRIRLPRGLRQGLLLTACLLAPGWVTADGSADRNSLRSAHATGSNVERSSGRLTDPITESAFLRDPTGRLQVEDLAAQPFQPYRGALTLGNTNIVTWLRLTVQPQSTGDWVVLVQPTLVQDVRVYEPRAEGGWRVQQLGSRFPHSQRLNHELNFVAPVSLAGPQPRIFYLRVHTPTSLVQARVVSAEEARELDALTHGAVGVYSGISLALMLMSLAGWLLTREPIWLYGSLLETSNLLLPLAQLGFLAKYLLPDSVNRVNQLVMAAGFATLASVALFGGWLLVLFGARRWCLAPYAAAVVAFPVLLGVLAAGRPGPALAASSLFVLVLAIWGLVMACIVRPQDPGLRWMWRGLSVTICLYTLFWVSPFVLYAQSTPLSFFPSLPSNMSNSIITVLLAARYTLLRSRSLRAAEQALQTADRHLIRERASHQETSGFLSMLVHEVRNPLARIQAMTRRLANGPAPLATPQTSALATIDRCADEINAVLQRSVETDQLERGALQARPQAEDAAERLSDWLALHRERERIEAEVPATLVATLDAGLWLSMVRNLVENALKYGPPGGTVRLRLHERDDQLCVDVANAEGDVGRPDPARLFDKYYRSARTEGITGTGLGLYWVYQLSQRLGGSLQYLPPAPVTGAVASGRASPATEGAVVFRLALPLDGTPAAP